MLQLERPTTAMIKEILLMPNKMQNEIQATAKRYVAGPNKQATGQGKVEH